jgi:hypothetical protein
MRPSITQKWALYKDHIGDYMHRWIFRTPWGTIRVHHILRSDAGRDYHDHPFSFLSFMLWGSYEEDRLDIREDGEWTKWREGHKAPAVIHRWAENFHRLTLPEGKTAWTLVFSTLYTQQWGFAVREPDSYKFKWIHHKDYKGEA